MSAYQQALTTVYNEWLSYADVDKDQSADDLLSELKSLFNFSDNRDEQAQLMDDISWLEKFIALWEAET